MRDGDGGETRTAVGGANVLPPPDDILMGDCRPAAALESESDEVGDLPRVVADKAGRTCCSSIFSILVDKTGW